MEWATEALWDNLWDGKTFIVFLFFWVVPLIKKWNDLGWAPATWMFFERAMAAMKALFWPAIVLAVVFVFLIFFVAPARKYQDLETKYQNLEKASNKPQPVVKEEESRQMIVVLQQQLINKDIEAQELKRLRDRAEDAEKRASSSITALRHSLEDKERVIRDLQGKADDKIARNDLKGKILIYLHSSQIIKQNCLSGLKDYSPIKEFERWHEQTFRELRDLGDGAYMIRFADTPPPNARSHYQVDGKPVSEECNQVAKVIDIKQAVLKDFVAELSR